MDIKITAQQTYQKVTTERVSVTQSVESQKNGDMEVEDKGSYYDQLTIEQLKAKADQAYNNLRTMVEDLLKKQGLTFKDLDVMEGEMVEIDDETRAKAQEAIEGEFSAEKVSESILQFAVAITGNNADKIDLVKSAIQEGFDYVEKAFGELPEISKETYDRVMEGLDRWADGGDPFAFESEEE